MDQSGNLKRGMEENGSASTSRLCRGGRRKRIRKHEREEEADRLSSLSNDLLHRIMSFLTTQQAVGTCVLSKRWESLWRSLPYLHLDFYAHSFRPAAHTRQRKRNFGNFITQLLVRRHTRDNLVRLRFTSHEYVEDSTLLEVLIGYALQCNVQELDIYAHSGRCIQFPTSSSSSSCRLLTTLKLETNLNGFHHRDDWYSFNINNHHLHFPALQTLHLVSIRASDPDFYSRTLSSSCCPNLQNLKLVDCDYDGIHCLSIRAPNLKNLEFVNSYLYRDRFEVLIDTPKLTSFKFDGRHDYPIWCFQCDLPSLDQVAFDLSWGDCVADKELFEEQEHRQNLVYTLTMFTHAKSLALSFQIIQVLSGLPALVEEGKLQFPNLKYLKLVGASQLKSVRGRDPLGNYVDVCDFFMPTSLLNRFLCNSPLVKICLQGINAMQSSEDD